MAFPPTQKNRPKKSLGQNYLTDENICRKIVDSFDIKSNDFVIEIGAGQGAITKNIIQQSTNYLGIELDNNNFKILVEKYPDTNFLNKDFLKFDFQSVIGKQQSVVRVIGNIPYNLTSEILFKLIDNRKLIQDAQLMIQEEVARRLTAKPNSKDYGTTTIATQTFSEPRLLFKVSRNCFFPKPNVDSRIVHLNFGNSRENKIRDVGHFRNLVRTSFGMRRKTLRNNLKILQLDESITGIDLSRRPETLSVDEFINLSNSIQR